MHEFGRMLGAGPPPGTTQPPLTDAGQADIPPWRMPHEVSVHLAQNPASTYTLLPAQIKYMRMPPKPENGYVSWWADVSSCNACKANMDAGPVEVGTAFPSGDYEPPAHDHCGCLLLISDAEAASMPDYPAYNQLRERYELWLRSQNWLDQRQVAELLAPGGK
jgi:hypothetical protein